jgi:dienelactone hydrolase
MYGGPAEYWHGYCSSKVDSLTYCSLEYKLMDTKWRKRLTMAFALGLFSTLCCGQGVVPSVPVVASADHSATESALRRSISELASGNPDYSRMTTALAENIRQALPQMEAIFKAWGDIRSITFKDTDAARGDVYDVTFANGAAEFSIALTPDGKIAGEGIRPTGVPPGLAAASPPVPKDALAAETGPYQVTAESADGRAGLRIFRPTDLTKLPERDSLPVVVWANGGCSFDVPGYAGFLTTIASHGFLVITTAGTPPDGDPMRAATADDLSGAIDWTEQENARAMSPMRGKIATRHVAVLGQSCGGALALGVGADPRVATVGLFNFGVESSDTNGPGARLPTATMDTVRALRASVLVINGGTSDAMMAPSKATFEAVGKAPGFYGSRHGAGHVATVFYPGGGEFANVASSWLLWQLKHDRKAGQMFAGDKCGLCTNPQWDVASKHLAR